MEPKPPLPPFTHETAVQKVRMAEDAWNTRDPDKCVLVYSEDTRWRNRNEFPVGRDAVRFAYECHDASGQWFRSYGNENWEFNEHGYMVRRYASINDLQIAESDRKFHWPIGRRPDDHPSLSDLDL
jgi:nuclear transport factor 2 (NTF2) superfamily protein